jgi:hypothetical protein
VPAPIQTPSAARLFARDDAETFCGSGLCLPHGFEVRRIDRVEPQNGRRKHFAKRMRSINEHGDAVTRARLVLRSTGFADNLARFRH